MKAGPLPILLASMLAGCAAIEPKARESTAWEQELGQWFASQWTVPRTLITGTIHCDAEVDLSEKGEVTEAAVLNSCGNPSLDRSLRAAILSSGTVPLPQDPADFRRSVRVPVASEYRLGPRERPLADLQNALASRVSPIREVFKRHGVQSTVKIVFAIGVAGSGEITSCTVVYSDFKDESLETDLVRTVQATHLPAKDVDDLVYESYPIVYIP